MLFLIEYDRRAGRIVTMQTFDEARSGEARDTRLELELALNRSGIDRELVVMDAADEAALRKTHRRYFADLAELATLPPLNGGPQKEGQRPNADEGHDGEDYDAAFRGGNSP